MVDCILLTYNGLRYMNVFILFFFNSLLNFCLYLVYCNILIIVQLCFFFANVIFTPVNPNKNIFKKKKFFDPYRVLHINISDEFNVAFSVTFKLGQCDLVKYHTLRNTLILFKTLQGCSPLQYIG